MAILIADTDVLIDFWGGQNPTAIESLLSWRWALSSPLPSHASNF
jgi:hypothetical protein